MFCVLKTQLEMIDILTITAFRIEWGNNNKKAPLIHCLRLGECAKCVRKMSEARVTARFSTNSCDCICFPKLHFREQERETKRKRTLMMMTTTMMMPILFVATISCFTANSKRYSAKTRESNSKIWFLCGMRRTKIRSKKDLLCTAFIMCCLGRKFCALPGFVPIEFKNDSSLQCTMCTERAREKERERASVCICFPLEIYVN